MQTYLDFRAITIDDLPTLSPILKEYGGSSCQHSFPAMFGLNAKYGDEFCFKDEVLFIHRRFRDHDGYRVYLAPLGDINEKAIRAMLDDAHSHSLKLAFETVTEEFLPNIDTSIFDIELSRDYSEYLYSSEELSTLSGKKLAAKRNRISAFHSSYDGRVRISKIEPSDIPDIKNFTQQWFSEKMESSEEPGLDSEANAISIYLDYYEELDFRGIIVRIDEKTVGYAAGVPLSDNTIDEVIEKGLWKVTGIYQVLCNEFAKLCCKDYQHINREEDLGLAGLRRAKESYQPLRLLNKYIIKEK